MTHSNIASDGTGLNQMQNLQLMKKSLRPLLILSPKGHYGFGSRALILLGFPLHKIKYSPQQRNCWLITWSCTFQINNILSQLLLTNLTTLEKKNPNIIPWAFITHNKVHFKPFINLTGLFPDFSIILLCHQSVDIHIRILHPKFYPIQILCWRVVHNNVYY